MSEYTWTGTTSGDLGVSTNWSPNGIPSTGDNVIFPASPTNPPSVGTLTIDGTITIDNGAIINSGTYITEATVAINNNGTISGGTFVGYTYNIGTVSGGEFNSGQEFDNYSTINGGTFGINVYSFAGTINGGTFVDIYVSNSYITDGTFNGQTAIFNAGSISGGTFNGVVSVASTSYGIGGGTFNEQVSLEGGSYVFGGTFKNISNGGAYIAGMTTVMPGTFVSNGQWVSSFTNFAFNITGVGQGVNGSSILGMI